MNKITTENEEILTIRKDIDNLDNSLLELLQKRMNLIAKVAKIKSSNNDKFFIRSAREADMIKNLTNNLPNSLPKSTIVNIWRRIITTANMYEQPIKIGIHNPKNLFEYEYVVRSYYGDIIPIINFDSTNSVVAALEKGEVQIGIFALPTKSFEDGENISDRNLKENWWASLANNKLGIKIFAKLPFTENEDSKQNHLQPLVAVAIKPAEQSQEDKTLLYVEIDSEINEAKLSQELQQSGLSAKIIRFIRLSKIDHVTFCLVEVNGFIDESSSQLQQFHKSPIKPYSKVLGHYPTTILIKS